MVREIGNVRDDGSICLPDNCVRDFVELLKYLLRQLLLTWKQGVILILTFVLCALGFITIVRPLKILKNDIEDKKALVTNGYYRFVVTGFNSSDLDSIEKELSGDGSEYMVACQKEFVVKYLNLYGEGKAIAITDHWMTKLENAYGKEQFRGFKLDSGRVPNKDREVLLLSNPYTYYEFGTSTDERVGKFAVLPEVGECDTTGIVLTDNSVSFPSEMRIGLIVTKADFNQISNGESINVFVWPDRTLDDSEVQRLKNTLYKYAEVETITYNETLIDTSGDEASLTLAVELSVLLIAAVVMCEMIVVSDFLKGCMNSNIICSLLGLSKSGCSLLSQIPIAIYLVLAEAILFIVLKIAEKSDAINFLNVCHPYDLLVMLFQFIVVLTGSNYIYFRLKGKEGR